MYSVPMLYQAEYMVDSNEKRNDRTVRSGTIEQTDRFWREDNLKPLVNQGDQNLSLSDVFPPNIAYEQVPKDRLDLFNQSLDSFEWGKKRIPPK